MIIKKKKLVQSNIHTYKYMRGRTYQTLSYGLKDMLETDFPSGPRETIPSEVTNDFLAMLDMTTRCACCVLTACDPNITPGDLFLEAYCPCIRGICD